MTYLNETQIAALVTRLESQCFDHDAAFVTKKSVRQAFVAAGKEREALLKAVNKLQTQLNKGQRRIDRGHSEEAESVFDASEWQRLAERLSSASGHFALKGAAAMSALQDRATQLKEEQHFKTLRQQIKAVVEPTEFVRGLRKEFKDRLLDAPSSLVQTLTSWFKINLEGFCVGSIGRLVVMDCWLALDPAIRYAMPHGMEDRLMLDLSALPQPGTKKEAKTKDNAKAVEAAVFAEKHRPVEDMKPKAVKKVKAKQQKQGKAKKAAVEVLDV